MNCLSNSNFCFGWNDMLLAQLSGNSRARRSMSYSGVPSYLHVRSTVRLREHDLGGFVRFIIALCAMKCCMLQLVSKIRPWIEVDDLCIAEMSIGYEAMGATVPFVHRQAHPPIAFFPTSPYCDLQR